ncbi:hypothetical protein [Pseudomonas simiae]|uniref:hypothetical protein n=1 Tax=Pseudomonas simiae TaxID=321846 RepID=UPI0005C3F673|nr:hypothetical protein [Pseudomonas simiae]AJP53303.1 hypothetical protein PF1751_v1c36030 [Pseudomonas simiae]
MEPRYKVKRKVHVELIGVNGARRTSKASPEGYGIFDTVEKRNLPGHYEKLPDAEAHCALLNRESKKLLLDDQSRALLNEIRALNTDQLGREIFVGLTHEESERYVALSMSTRHKSAEEQDEYLSLDEKYNSQRMQVIGAEHLLRTENPPIH